MSPYLAEYVGTALLVLFGDGVVANVLLKKSKGEGGGWIVIAMGWGLAVMIGAYAVGTISGAHMNPALTIGLAAIGKFDAAKVPGYIAAQMLGAMTGAGLVWVAYWPHWKETPDAALKRAVFCTAPAIRCAWANLACEMIGTAALVFGILAIPSSNNLIKPAWTTGFGPMLAGLVVLAIGLSLGGPTGYAINPARDLGPRIMHALLPVAGKGDSDWGYAWIPVAGPFVGGLLGAWLHQGLFG